MPLALLTSSIVFVIWSTIFAARPPGLRQRRVGGISQIHIERFEMQYSPPHFCYYLKGGEKWSKCQA